MQLKILRNATSTREWVSRNIWLEEESFFDWSHMAALFFQAHRGSRTRMCTIQISKQIKQKQKTFNQNYFEERVTWKKSPQTFFDSGNYGKMIKR